jgi:hypothetical protein
MPGHGKRSDAWFAARRLGPLGRWLGDRLLDSLPEADRVVDRECDACIEGFPRSANTLAVRGFLRANPDARIAHHLHIPAQVARACDLGVPCAVTIREPAEAISSYLVMISSPEFAAGRQDGPEQAVVRYLDFYRRIAPLRRQIALCRFEDVVEDPSVIARALNRRYRTRFDDTPFDGRANAELIAAIEQRHRRLERDIAAYSLPRSEKDSLKAEVRPRVEDQPLLGDARRLYAELTSNGTG